MNVRTPDGLVHLMLYEESTMSYGETACLIDYARAEWERTVPLPEWAVLASRAPDGEILTCLVCATQPHTPESRHRLLFGSEE